MATAFEFLKNLERLSDKIDRIGAHQFSITPDSNGMIDRQCPQCNVQFKVTDFHWNKIEGQLYCPSCGEMSEKSDFLTDQHMEQLHNEFNKAVKKSLFENEDSPRNIISLNCLSADQAVKECPNCDARISTEAEVGYCHCCGNRVL